MTIAGYAIVGLVFAGCLGLTKWFSGGSKGASDAVPHSSSVIPILPSAKFVAAVLAWLLLVELGVETWYRAHERDLQPSARWSVRWPESAPQFREMRIDERTRSLLHQDEGRGALWNVAGAEGSQEFGGHPATALLYFFKWYPGHNSALLANSHRPDVCLPASGWKQTGDSGVKTYRAAPGLSIPFRHFEFVADTGGRTRYAHAFYCIWEDRVAKRDGDSAPNMSSTPSAWDRRERIQAVIDGRRHLGQQVMEYLIVQAQPISSGEAEAYFSSKLPELVAPAPKSL